VANLFERTRRASFAQTEQLAHSNASLTSRRDEVDRLNQALRRAVERAERESAARTRVLAAASHDLRQPLHALSIYSAILAEDPVPETLREVGAHIDQTARTLGALLHGLLDLSQLSSGHYVPARQRVAMHETLESICLEHEADAAAKGLRLCRELAPMAWRGDTMAVSRIARNLLGNAIKYTTAGSVTLRLAAEGAQAVLVVEDTGMGIPPEAQPRIFEEFYQVGNQGRDRSQGVGLGLAIVRRLVELSAGGIALASEPGVGSRFTVKLPGVEPEAEAAEGVAGPGDAAGGAAAAAIAGPAEAAEAIAFSGRVYLVDDEPDIQRSMAMLLRSWQCQAFTAADAVEAVALFESEGPPDLLIVDLRLRGAESGAALVERLQRSHGSFPVLVITGETASDLLRGATRAGWALLYKPIAAAMLRDALARVLPRR
jgi:signal transduction histidine kinase